MDFDQHARTYSDQIVEALRYSHCSHEFFLEVKAGELLKVMRETGSPSAMNVLEVGCGTGLMAGRLTEKVAHLWGVDVSADIVRIAAGNVPRASFATSNGLELPFGDGSFDVAFAVCVMHHVEPSKWQIVLEEMTRVVKPGGLVAIFEHNPWNPATRWVVNHCEFDRDATLLPARVMVRLLNNAPVLKTRMRFILFFPWKGRLWRRIETFLGWLPLGAQYVTTGIRAPLQRHDESRRESADQRR